MNRAFLSHSSAQKDFVRKIYNALGAPRCVFDECCFDNGKMIFEEILRGLQNTDLFVLFISNESLDSEWVQQEIILTDTFRQKYGMKQVLRAKYQKLKADMARRDFEQFWQYGLRQADCHQLLYL